MVSSTLKSKLAMFESKDFKNDTIQDVKPVDKIVFPKNFPPNTSQADEKNPHDSNAKVAAGDNPKYLKKDTNQDVKPVNKIAFPKKFSPNTSQADEKKAPNIYAKVTDGDHPKDTKKDTNQDVKPVRKIAFPKKFPPNTSQADEKKAHNSNAKATDGDQWKDSKNDTNQDVKPVRKFTFPKKFSPASQADEKIAHTCNAKVTAGDHDDDYHLDDGNINLYSLEQELDFEDLVDSGRPAPSGAGNMYSGENTFTSFEQQVQVARERERLRQQKEKPVRKLSPPLSPVRVNKLKGLKSLAEERKEYKATNNDDKSATSHGSVPLPESQGNSTAESDQDRKQGKGYTYTGVESFTSFEDQMRIVRQRAELERRKEQGNGKLQSSSRSLKDRMKAFQ
jgi:hypothetical protein